MLITLSPAKSLDYESKVHCKEHSMPRFLSQSEELIKILRKKDENDLSKLMGISKNISKLNFDRYKKWNKSFKNNDSKQAIFAFNGAVYKGFNFSHYKKEDFQLLQNRSYNPRMQNR